MSDRIQVRAYFLAQNDDYAQSPEHYWFAAERVERNIAAMQVEIDREAAERRAKLDKRNAAARARRARKLHALPVPASFDPYSHLRNAPAYAN